MSGLKDWGDINISVGTFYMINDPLETSFIKLFTFNSKLNTDKSSAPIS